MNITARAGAAVKHLVLGIGVGAAVLVIALAGVGFLMAAFYIYAAHHMDAASAAALTGAVLAVLAVLVAVIGAGVLRRMKKQQPGWLSDFGGTLGLGVRLASMMVRRDPKKALMVAAISGVLVELILSDGKKEK
jgi:hypothetical protein